ncbi:nucleoside-diphosphate sugar epimerase/dehydratase [Peptococcaceae bacterium 1198_IL3148]
MINLAIIIPYLIRFEGNIPALFLEGMYVLMLIATPVLILIFYYTKLYHRVWSYASTDELIAIIHSISAGSLVIIFLTYMVETHIPRSIILMFWAFCIIFISGSRFAWQQYIRSRNKGRPDAPTTNKKILIYGAGDAGALVAREYKNHYNGNQPVVGFVDDDYSKHNLSIHGLLVLGGRGDISNIVSKYGVNEVIIAMPSVAGAEIKEIVEICKKHVPSVKILPGVYQLLDGKVTLSKIRPIDIEDLLGREPVQVNLQEISLYLHKKVVMVTGAGGSIGSELCRQVCELEPQKLILLGHGENSIYEIWLELRESYPNINLAVEIADIRDRDKLQLVFSKHKPNVVFHAAAHKHVPLMEMHPDEAIKTNVFGTKNVAELADQSNCDAFVFISTDKAVNPSSVMGATKRMAELIVQNMFKGSKTKFVAVRFGNVLGSRGSVVPIFKEQIAKGGPVTVTHPEMKRYFMTIPEAVQLVIQAGAMAQGGEIFVLDMGEPVKIVDLATNLIKLSGFDPGKDIEIKYTGVRPGEKLFEELLTAEEGSASTQHKRIFVAKPVEIEHTALTEEIMKLAEKDVLDNGRVFESLARIMPNFISYQKAN